MRVGVLIYGDLDTISGGYLYDRKLVQYLHSQGDEVEIISLPWRNYGSHLADNFSRKLLRQLQELNVAVLLQDELNHPSLFLLNRRLRNKVSYPIISIVHHLRGSEYHPAWIKSIYRAVERRYLTSVNGFIFNSRTTREVVEKVVDVDAPAVVAVPGGDQLSPHVSRKDVASRLDKNGPLRILFLGNVIRRKGLHTLIEALLQLPEDSWRLSVIGNLIVEGAYVKQIRRMISKNELDKHIKFSGALRDEALSIRMKQCDVLVVPSYYEGYGISYIEAMGFGMPAIGSTGGAAHEIITDGENGYLIAPGDVGTLTARLLGLDADRQHLTHLSLAALKHYQSHPTWEDTGKRIRNFLLGL